MGAIYLQSCVFRSALPVCISGIEHKRKHQQEELRSTVHLNTPRYYLRAAKRIYEMSRPVNLVPSFALTFGGGWLSSGRNFGVLCAPNLWIASACSALVSAASMLINDYYDHKLGTDEMNGKLTAMEAHEIDPVHVVAVAGWLYGIVVCATFFLEPMQVRFSVVISALLTLVYTPLLKKLTLVKNLTVAGIVANAVVLGGMATGGVSKYTNLISSYVFLMILGREILMDAKDVYGDMVTGVRSIAVSFGVRTALVLAATCAIGAQVLLVMLLWSRTHRIGCTLFAAVIGVPLHSNLLYLYTETETLDHALIDKVVGEFMLSLAAGATVAANML